MKQVAILLLMALMLDGCSSNSKTLQSTTTGIFQAVMYGGVGEASGFSFITDFTLNSNDTLNVSFFQFLTENTLNNTPCFPINGGTVSGLIADYMVNSDDTVSGTLTMIVKSGSNTLTLTGDVTGTATVTGTPPNTQTVFTSATISGTWTLKGTPECTLTAGDNSFIMTQGST
jgi:hypothetical protein